ncbi:hypothetical protein TcasGA2_TC031750 [Tribolium castaneum]|uniref:Uncharacterized protein n=1 Tax=Tribolium castaneum TaxID=7070 RepID=A0A139W8A8_TRICA|nr:PREDICTED: uncharacterized protein LOC107399204 [Tribolium castaneum]KXZ75514.1 hypothetical protein TcasGA2_TC031750 [Tribolium castaneum]|eukprot:XP_015840454.1 PREDICTED: uncharacterized protein LOC107399204 [Tribolium castaneum]
MKLVKLFVVLAVVVACFRGCGAVPVGNPETAIELMAQIPQWHCMRYRKFELVRRCRGYKNSLRRL